jgi:oxygen-independent coproporphyrinogen-3 oxidase
MKSIESGEIPFEIEILTTAQQLNEYIMTALRTMEGISAEIIAERWGNVKKQEVLHAAEHFINENYLSLKDDFLQLTQKGKFLADGIAAELFTEET